MLILFNWLIALAPVLVLAGLFAWLDQYKLMSKWEMIGVIILGALAAFAAYPASGRFLDALPMGFSDYSRFAAPWIEEALKAMVVIALFGFNRVGFKLDAAVQGFAIGAGFAVVENIIYLARFDYMAPTSWLVRGLGTAVMHGGTAAIMMTLTHEMAEHSVQRKAAHQWRLNPLWILPGYVAAVAIHAAYNQFPDQPMLAMLAAAVLVPFALFAIFHFGTGEAHALLDQDHDEHAASLAQLESGHFPDTESGRRIAAFAASYRGGASARVIKEYLTVTTWLVLHAEKTLLQQAESRQLVMNEDARAGFLRLKAAEEALGGAAIRQLQPMLPFTRNDLWEISELRERVQRG